MPAKRYAANTNVSSDKSRSQIEKALIRYGATHFGYASEPKRSIIQFEMNHRRIRFVLPMPDPADDQFKFRTYGGKPTTTARTESERVKGWLKPQLEKSYSSGELLPMLPGSR